MILGVSQARIYSSRYPQKILQNINSDLTALDLHLSRITKSKLVNRWALAIADEGPESRALVEIAHRHGVTASLGSITDVLDRYYNAGKMLNPKIIVRVTSDCPLIDSEIIDLAVNSFCSNPKIDYLSNTQPATFPDGQDVEVFTWHSLCVAWEQAKDPAEREHVTPYIWRRPKKFAIAQIKSSVDYSQLRMTLDYPDDLAVLRRLVEQCGTDANWKEYSKVLEKMAVTPKHIRNETLKFKGEIGD